MRRDIELIADPERLTEVVAEAARFTRDLHRIAEGVLSLADDLGIAEDVADRVVGDALHGLAGRSTDVG
jgi:hypothetical protein